MAPLGCSIGTVQGCTAFDGMWELLSAMERDMGCALDWRSTAFWRERSFNEAWEAWWNARNALPRSPEDNAQLAAVVQYACASLARLDACTSVPIAHVHCDTSLPATLPLGAPSCACAGGVRFKQVLWVE